MNKTNKLTAALMIVVSIVLVIFIKVGCSMAGKSIGAKITQNRNLNEVDEFLAAPFYAKLKEVEPQTYKELKEKLTTAIKNGGGDEEVSPILNEYTSAVSQRRLRHATPETAKKSLDLRLLLLKKLYDVSPEYMCSAIFKEPVGSQITETDLKDDIFKMLNEMSMILFAPESQKPIAQDDKLAEKLFQEIAQSLNQKDRDLIGNHSPDSKGGKLTDPVKVKAYCDAYFRLYKKIAALENTKVLQVLRFLQEIPPDDRVARQ